MKRILILICLFAAVGTAQAEAFDSLRIVLKIFDKDTKAPISATTRFESMPYGNKIGLRHGAEVIFRIESGEVFNVMVKAEGYMPVTITIDQKDYLGIHEIIEEVELTTNRIGHVMRLENMNFAQSSSEITQEMHEELDKLVVMLKGHPSMEIRLEGHTDYRGDAKANMKLSEERVKAVREYLVGRGVERSRVDIKAFGGTQPLSTEGSEKAHASNRRVEVRITKH